MKRIIYSIVCVLGILVAMVLTTYNIFAQEDTYTIVGQVFIDENCSGNRIPLKDRIVVLKDENNLTVEVDFTSTLGLYGFDVERNKQYYVQTTTESDEPYLITIPVFATSTGFGRRIDFNVIPCEQYFPVINNNTPSVVNSSNVPNTDLIVKLNEKECAGRKLRPIEFTKVQLIADNKIVYEDFTNEQGLAGFANLPNNFNFELHILYFRRQIININTGDEPIKRIDLNLAHCPLFIPLINVAPPFNN